MTTISKIEAERMLAEVPEGRTFWCCDNRILKNLRELEDALGTMSDDTYACHANAEKNDFSNWVRDVIGDAKLGGDLRKAANKMHAAKAVRTRLAFLENKL
jgi:hypothetical protein